MRSVQDEIVITLCDGDRNKRHCLENERHFQVLLKRYSAIGLIEDMDTVEDPLVLYSMKRLKDGARYRFEKVPLAT